MKTIHFIYTLLGVFTLISCGSKSQSHDFQRIKVASSQFYGLKAFSDQIIVDHQISDQEIFAYADTQTLDALEAEFPEIILEDANEPELSPRDGYHDYEELTELLESLAQEHSEILSLHTAGESVDGRELWYVKISDNVEIRESIEEPKLLYIGNMHGDETVGREMLINLIEHLVANYQSDEKITNLIDNSIVYILPSMNPDGFERGRRWNSNGKDLNRNFPDFMSSNNSENTLEGKEVETQAIMKLHENNHFQIAMNMHGGALCMNLPWDTKANRTDEDKFGDDPLMYKISRDYTISNQKMYNGRFDNGLTYGYEWYEVNGGLQDWANYYHQSVHSTVELSNTKYPSAQKLPGFWEDNQEALVDYLYSGLTGIFLNIKSDSQILIEDLKLEYTIDNITRSINYSGNSLLKTMLAGSHDITISAKGHNPKTVNIDTWSFDGKLVDFVLTPSLFAR